MPEARSNSFPARFSSTAIWLGIFLLLNILVNLRVGDRPLYAKLDLTEEQRYSLTEPTRRLLRQVDDVVFVKVLLDGPMPSGFRRLQESVHDLLREFRSENGRVTFEFTDPNEGSVEEINARREQLAKDGLVPVNLRVKETDGTSERLIFPYAVINYKGRSLPVKLLENEVPGVNPEVVLNNSITLLEYKLANAIHKLRYPDKPNIVFTRGQGELSEIETRDLEKSLRQYYNTGRLHLDSVVALSPEIAALVIAKPRAAFSEKDKFKIDQYVMNGGKVLWLLDAVAVTLDSLQQRAEFYPTPYQLDLEDLLFRYGLRIEPTLVLDLQCSRIPLATGMVGKQPQFDYFAYPYHIVAVPEGAHPVIKNLDAVNLLYPNQIDTAIETRPALEKTVLLRSSRNSLVQYLPLSMDFEFLRYDLDPMRFNKPPQPLAVLLEGQFSSLYANRVSPGMAEGLRQLGQEFRAQSQPTAMLVVADGDIAKNPVRDNRAGPLGYNAFERYTFANKEFLLNAIEYLLDPDGVISARGKEVRLRLLDKERTQTEGLEWQLFNIALPLAILAVFGLGYHWWRRRRFAR